MGRGLRAVSVHEEAEDTLKCRAEPSTLIQYKMEVDLFYAFCFAVACKFICEGTNHRQLSSSLSLQLSGLSFQRVSLSLPSALHHLSLVFTCSGFIQELLPEPKYRNRIGEPRYQDCLSV